MVYHLNAILTTFFITIEIDHLKYISHLYFFTYKAGVYLRISVLLISKSFSMLELASLYLLYMNFYLESQKDAVLPIMDVE